MQITASMQIKCDTSQSVGLLWWMLQCVEADTHIRVIWGNFMCKNIKCKFISD